MFWIYPFDFDMHKAFDNLNHNLMIQKLLRIGTPTGFLMLLKNYLTDRHACVQLNRNISEYFLIVSGVPQGTILAPYLFAAFFGDFHCMLQTTDFVKYADDLTLILPVSTKLMSEIEKNVNCEIEFVTNWCKSNDLKLNMSKSNVLPCFKKSFTSPSCHFPIKVVDYIDILGLRICHDLSWAKHVQKIVKIANKRFYALRKLWPFVSSDELHLLYTSYIRSILEYACPVFVGLNKTLSNCLNIVDKRAHKIIYRNNERKCQCSENELIKRRYTQSKKLFLSIENDEDHILNAIIPKRHSYSRSISIPFVRTERSRTSFVPFTSVIINDTY